MPDFVWYSLFFAVYGWINGLLSIYLYHWNNKRADKRFMKYLRIKHPDSIITLSSVESNDREALKQLKEKLDALS